MLLKNLIKEIRMKCLISQKVLGEWADIDQVSISHYERGTRMPGLLARKKIVDVANEKAGMNIKYSDLES